MLRVSCLFIAKGTQSISVYMPISRSLQPKPIVLCQNSASSNVAQEVHNAGDVVVISSNRSFFWENTHSFFHKKASAIRFAIFPRHGDLDDIVIGLFEFRVGKISVQA